MSHQRRRPAPGFHDSPVTHDLDAHLAALDPALVRDLDEQVGAVALGRRLQHHIVSALAPLPSKDGSDTHKADAQLALANRLLAVLRALCRRPRAAQGRAAVRVLTTAYMMATERRALDALQEMGADVRVSQATAQTRLHAKAWLFHPATGFSTGYVGSSNLSAAQPRRRRHRNAQDHRGRAGRLPSIGTRLALATRALPAASTRAELHHQTMTQGLQVLAHVRIRSCCQREDDGEVDVGVERPVDRFRVVVRGVIERAVREPVIEAGVQLAERVMRLRERLEQVAHQPLPRRAGHRGGDGTGRYLAHESLLDRGQELSDDGVALRKTDDVRDVLVRRERAS